MDNPQRVFELLQANHAEGVLRLLDEDPSLAGATDGNGVSLVMQSLYRGQRDLARTVAGRKTSLDVFEAAALGHLDRLRALLDNGSNAASFSPDGFTALHFAAFFSQPEAARLLLEKGAPPDAVAANAMQVTPLHSAASVRNLEAARLLLQHGASIHARQQGGWTPLHAAAQNGDRDMVALFLEHRADVRLANDAGKTPAMIAREKGHSQIAEALEAQAAKS